MKLPTRDQLVKRRAIVIADAQMKLECADWHGCADACMDLREIDARITLFDEIRAIAHGESLALAAEHLSDNPDRTYNI